jgi:hypothetical protein
MRIRTNRTLFLILFFIMCFMYLYTPRQPYLYPVTVTLRTGSVFRFYIHLGVRERVKTS